MCVCVYTHTILIRKSVAFKKPENGTELSL